MVTFERPTCGTCVYYESIGAECRRHAPTERRDNGMARWPVVNAGSHWCGDHQSMQVIQQALEKVPGW